MENLVNFKALFGGTYAGRRVLVTGHTGFKGSWLVQWLRMMGAEVFAYALEPAPGENHFALLGPEIQSEIGDIRHSGQLETFFAQARPEIVFHLAAQALVRASFVDPVTTYSTNVMGSLHVLEAARKTPSVKAIVVVTSDKCYENREWVWGYRETDPMGGFDPYSSSKGCTEILTASYRNSYFPIDSYGKSHGVLLGSARAGNVIGGGDWATDRLIPDLIRSATRGQAVRIRNPRSTRPWQHVLEPLSGYLLLGFHLLNGKVDCAEGWNFGPGPDGNIPVVDVVSLAKTVWPEITVEFGSVPEDQHEANLLMLDCSKALRKLEWTPVWGIQRTIEHTIQWYKTWYTEKEIMTIRQIGAYVAEARQKQVAWTH